MFFFPAFILLFYSLLQIHKHTWNHFPAANAVMFDVMFPRGCKDGAEGVILHHLLKTMVTQTNAHPHLM
jgi:hypothetical protein